jgi:iron complex outermembrane receptor protein
MIRMPVSTTRLLVMTWTATLSLVPCAGLAAQADLFDLGPAQLAQIDITIATGTDKPIASAPAVATVITAEQIAAAGAVHLDDVLEMVPGLHVGASNNISPSTHYIVRGIRSDDNSRILLLLDGVPITDTFIGGQIPNFRLPVAAIERIEVIRGPGSALFGADAFTGVINVITRTADDIDGTEVGARGGSFGTRNAWIQHGNTLAGWKTALTFEYLGTDGDPDRMIDADAQTAIDARTGTRASRAPGELESRYDLLNAHLNVSRADVSARLWGWHIEDAGVGFGGAQALNGDGAMRQTQLLAEVDYVRSDLLEDWKLAASASYFYWNAHRRFTLFPPGAVLPIGADGNVNFTMPVGFTAFPAGLIGDTRGRSHNGGFELSGQYGGWAGHRLRFSAGIQIQSFSGVEADQNFGPGVLDGTQAVAGGALSTLTDTQFIFASNAGRSIVSLSAQDEWNFAPRWNLTAGIRLDHYSDFGTTVNPRLALVWEATDTVTAKALYGRAFRAPTFGELGLKNNPSALGNPALGPETVNTVEVGVEYRPRRTLRTALNVFGYRLGEQIELQLDPVSMTRMTQNAGDQEGYGFQAEIDWQATRSVRLAGNYAWQHSKDVSTGARVPDVPGQQAHVSADWRVRPRWSVHGQLNWVADRKRPVGDLRSAVEDYATVDLGLRYDGQGGDWGVTFTARNIFDADTREPSNAAIPGDIPLEGRSAYLGVRLGF